MCARAGARVVCAYVYRHHTLPRRRNARCQRRFRPFAFSLFTISLFSTAQCQTEKKLAAAVTGSRKLRSRKVLVIRFCYCWLAGWLAGYLPALPHGITQLPPPLCPRVPEAAIPIRFRPLAARRSPIPRSLIGSTGDKSQRHRPRRERRSHQI